MLLQGVNVKVAQGAWQTKEFSMTEKELRKLNRAELLELLLEQAEEVERLRKKLETAEKLLTDRHLRVEFAGNLAEAVLAVNGVMETAQKAADQYLLNIAKMEEQTRLRCEQMLQQAQLQAEGICKEICKNITGEADEIL